MHSRQAMRAAGVALETVREALLSPNLDNLRAATLSLERAVAAMSDLRRELERDPPPNSERAEWRAEIERLGRQLHTAEALHAQAGGYYDGWALILLGALAPDLPPGYTPEGQMNYQAPMGRVWVTG